jgi:hypothetical protein
LAQSAKALIGSAAVNDVTLTGTVEWIAGSDDEAGTATYKGLSGSYRLDLSFRNGMRSEIVSPVNGAPAGNWIGLDGISHPMANHNLVVNAGWFPALTLGNLISSSSTILSYVGQEIRNNSQVIHIIASQQFPQLSGDSAALMQRLSQVDIYLDPTILLPVSYVYNAHPDNDLSVDISTEIRYSNFQIINGCKIPMRIQKFVNNSLTIDLQIQSALVNTGLPASTFDLP